MAQQTLSDLRERLRSWSNRGDLTDTLLDDFINIALARTLRILRVPIMESTSTITLVDNSAEIPRDYLEAIDLRFSSGGNTCSLERKDLPLVQELASQKTGTPKYFARRGTKFYLAPTPSGVDEVTLYYYITLQPLVNDSDTNWFVADSPELLLYGALAEIALYVRDEVSANYWEAKFRAHAKEVQQLADDAQWSGGTLSVTAR